MCKFIIEERDVVTKRRLNRLGFSAADIAVENMGATEIRQHVDFLDNKTMDLSIGESINSIHDILDLWGASIPPGYTLDVPEGDNSQVVRYCEYHYVDRKVFTVKLFGGSLYYTGTAVISRKKVS